MGKEGAEALERMFNHRFVHKMIELIGMVMTKVTGTDEFFDAEAFEESAEEERAKR